MRFLSNPRFQIKFLAYSCGIALLVTLLLFLVEFLFFWRVAHGDPLLGFQVNESFLSVLGQIQLRRNILLGVTSLLIFSTIAAWAFLISHRIVGPLDRLRKHMDSVAKGETLEDVEFRKDDFFPELARSYNRQLSKLRPKEKRNPKIKMVR